MPDLQKSTVATVRVGPILNATTFAVVTTGPVIGDFYLSKNGGSDAALASTATATHVRNGYWDIALRTGDTDTIGNATIVMNNSSYTMPVKTIKIVGPNLWGQQVTNDTAWGTGTSTLTQTQVTGGAHDMTTTPVLLTAGQGVTVSGEGRNLGDFPTTATIKIQGNCALNGAAAVPVFTTLEIYKDGNTTQNTLTDSVNGTVVNAAFDSVTGKFEIEVALSNAGWSGFFVAGSYSIVWTAGTVGGTAIGYVRTLASFSVNLSAAYTSVAAGVVVNSGTVTTVTNQLTAAQIATGVWQDTTSGDFTVSSSIGKSLFTSGNAPGAASGLAIVGSAMTLSASQHVIVDSGTVTTVTNQLTAAQIATGIWQDTTAGDFTTSGSIGKSLFTSGNAPGASSGIAIVGSSMVAGTVNDKTGYSLTQTFPSNFSSMTISSGGVTNANIVQIDGQSTTGTCQAGSSSTTIVLASGNSSTDSSYKDYLICLDGGTGSGQFAIIRSYVGSTRTATIDRTWLVTPSTDTTYRILGLLSPAKPVLLTF